VSTPAAVQSTPQQTAARKALGYENPYAHASSPVYDVVRTGHGTVISTPVAVTGRVRTRNPGYRVRGVAWTPRYQFRVPAVYREYFSPYVTYIDETYWATDWVITDALVSEEMMMETPSDLGSPAMDVSVKEQLREEVALDMSGPAETEASVDDPRIKTALANPAHIFLVPKDMTVQNHKGVACTLGAADLVRPQTRISADENNVNVVVLASKGGECVPGEQVVLTTADLADFEHALLTRVDHARDAAHEGDTEPAAAPDL